MRTKFLVQAAGISGALAVVLGALGAHALKSVLSTDMLNAFETAVRYHLIHSLLMLVLAVLIQFPDTIFNHQRIILASKLILAGIICFSGSIYLLSTRTLWGADILRILGPITPIGGILLVAGWLTLVFSIKFKKL
jgi:uncharacterized membrane protein YgdD (TMEM256/DUF423 family)